jgi:hypothetical protein
MYDSSPPQREFDAGGLKIGDIYKTQAGYILGVIVSIDKNGMATVATQGQIKHFTQTLGRAYGKAFAPIEEALKKLAHKSRKQSDYVLFPAAFDHKPFEIKPGIQTRPAHSMAPPPGARLYDHRGRKRY